MHVLEPRTTNHQQAIIIHCVLATKNSQVISVHFLMHNTNARILFYLILAKHRF